jgi:hypothetical protein
METRPFKLSSYDISPSNNLADYYKQTVTTQYGTVADNRMSLTWNNVNLQQIVGNDFYNAYNRFTIKLVNQAWYGAPTSDSGTTYSAQNYQDQFVNVYLKGLPFYPPVYNSPDGALVNTLDTGILSTTVGGTVGRSNVSNSINQTFLKTSTANISINIRCVATEQPYSPADISTYIWGHSVYHFEITGISDVSNVSYIDLSNNTLLNYGQHSIYTELTPTDRTNYFASSNVTNINVLAYTSSISFSATIPTSIVYETNLTNILVTTVGVTQGGVTPQGTTRYYLDSVFTKEIFATTLLNYGSHTIYALFTPNSSDYANSSVSTSLIVTQQSSTLTYSTLPSIVYGTTMESSLIASSSAPGTIQYYYNASYTQLVDIADIKDAGTYTIYAIYTSETNNYSSSSANSSLTIAVASTTLSYEPLSAITYPATIASSLTASSTVEGTVNYYLDSAYTQLVTSTNILNAGTYTLYALFTPSSSNYSSSTANRSITVNKFAPTITLPTIASFVYETTLSDLVTGTTVDIIAGTLSFYIGNESGTLLTSSTVLSVGSYTIFCKFTPTDTTNYFSASSTTSLTVTTQSTTIGFSSAIPTSVEYETTLANILNTTASNAGTVNYYYVSSGANVAVTTSTVLQVGTYTIYAQLIPTNSDYASSTTSTSLTVTHKTVVITYSNLPNIYYRTTASTSLNATVSPAIAGSFRYFTNVDQTGEVLPATLLNVNNYTIHTYFTPSNSNYTSAYASTSLIVNKFTPTIDLPTSSIVYGTQISSCFIAEISPSSIEGTTTYYLDSNHTDAIESTEVFSVGTYTLYARFTPTNTLNYTTASTSDTITVTKQPTTLTFPNISSFVYETTLANFITGTTVSGGVPGTFNFFLNNLSGTALSSSTVLETGVYTIFCQFVPTDTTNYSSTTATKSLTVNVLATTIVFSSSIPTTIVYGTTLAQLVNTVVTPNVTGTVRYYTNGNQTTEVFSTTILNVATYTLYAVFTPQMDDYATSSTSTQLSVTKATTTVTYPTLSAIAYGTSMNTSLTAYVSPSMQGVFNYYYVSPFFVNGTNKVSIGANDVLKSGTYTIFVNFVPSNSNYTGSTNSQSLTITATPTTVIYNTLPNIVYATTLASSLNATIYPNISGTMKYYIDADQVFPTTTPEVGTYSIRATFTPTSNNYVTSTTTKTLTVNKIPTTITFPSLSSIVYQTTLTDIISSTSTEIPGTYSFRLNNATGLELSSTTVLETGTYTIFCKFEPTDSAHYLSSESTKSLVVTGLPTTLAYSPSIVSSIAYETTLADVLNTSVTPSLAGTTVYKIGDTVVTSSTVLALGTYTITSTFTPTDDNYAQSTVTTALSVTALPTTLSFSIPSSIVYETTMNSSLTATCTKPGTIAYYYDSSYSSVVSGNNVPNVGSYTIYAVFTPSTANYLSSTASASLTVTQRATNIAFSQSIPTTITYETTLNEVLNTSLTSGTTTYYYLNSDSVQVNVSSTTVLSVGTYTITALFTPSSGNYATSTATTQLLVSQKPIVVTYSGLPAITYGATLSSSLNATLSQTVDGTLNYYTDNSLTSSVISTTVLNAGSYTIYAKFNPTSANYVSYTVNTGLTVNKVTPIVTYDTLPSIAYGTTLQSSFTASANVSGTIAYFLLNDPIIGSQILNAGTYTLRAQFTPTDATNYESIFATSSLIVSKITPTITFTSISTITYETSLSSFVSETIASVAGTFMFYLEDSTILTSSTVLNAGSYTIYASFTPSDTTNYTATVVSSTSLQVQKKATSITLSSISSIVYGTTLASFISGTTSSVPGTFMFTETDATGQTLTSSKIMNAGTYTIYCSFTPTNTTNYNVTNASKTSFVVSKQTSTITLSSQSSITYGTTLSSFINGTTASTSGTFQFNETNELGAPLTTTSVLNVATYTIFCTFTPSNTSNYSTATTSKSFTVNKKIPSLTMAELYGFVYGTTFESFITNTTASVAGTFQFNLTNASGQLLTASTILTAASYTIFCTFTPTDTTNYSTKTDTKTQFVVSKQSTIITMAEIDTIVYGTTFADYITGTTSSVAGTFTFNQTDANGQSIISTTKLVASTYFIYCNFTPTDTTNYSISSAIKTLLVTKQIPSITLSSLTGLIYGTTMSTFISGTTATVPGTFTFTQNNAVGQTITSSTILSAATYTIYCSFTPTDSANYTTATAINTSFTVTKQSTTITLSVLTGITYETTMASLISGTTASVPGTFQFNLTDSAGQSIISTTVLNAGTYSIYCVFTPTDFTNYLSSNATMSSFVVSKKNTTLTLSSMTGITYGTTLASFISGTTASVPGTFVFNQTNSSGVVLTSSTILATATYAIYCKFTPTNSNNYNTSSNTKSSFVVSKSTTTITLSTISTLIYGTNFSSYIAGTVARGSAGEIVAGTFAFKQTNSTGTNITSSTKLVVGSYQIYCTFTPSNTVNYSSSTKTSSTNALVVSKATPTITMANISTITYGTTFASYITGTTSLNAGTFQFNLNTATGTTLTSSSVLAVGTYTIYCKFTSTDTTNYTSNVTKTKSLSVTKETPTITMSSLTGLTYGTTMSSFISGTTASVAGTFIFKQTDAYGSTIISSTVLTAQTYTIFCQFTPTDTANYVSPVTASKTSFVVSKKSTTVSISSLTTIVYGTTLTAFINATTVSPSIPGTFVFKQPNWSGEIITNTTLLPVGTYTIYCRFTPTDTTNYVYDAATRSSFVVSKANTTITMSSLNGFNYGTTFNSFMAGTTASVDGTFRFNLTNSSGQLLTNTTILSVGTYTIYCAFTPTDTINYNSSTATKSSVIVSKVTPTITMSSITGFTYGTTFNNFINSTSASVAGTMQFRLNSSSGTIVTSTNTAAVATYTIYCIFTPTDTTNYNSTTVTKSNFVVSKQAPIITMSSISSIITGSTLSSYITGTTASTTVTGTTASASGTLSFNQTDAAGAVLTSSSVLSTGTYTIFCKFTPTDTTNFSTVTATQSLIVSSKTPTTITISSISSMTYGTTLTSFISQTTASVEGTLTFNKTDATGQVLTSSSILSAGSNTIYCSFSPTNSTTYEKSMTTTVVTVDKATTTITLSSLTGITYNTTLASFINETTASVAGTLTFNLTNASGTLLTTATVLNAASYTIFCTFTPTDSANYLSSTASRTSFVVSKQTTTITLSSISTLIYGNTLQSFISGTTSSVTGTLQFRINDESGQLLNSTTLLNAGTYTIYSSFTPSDSLNYLSSTATKSITVSKQTPVITLSALSDYVYGTLFGTFIDDTDANTTGTFQFNQTNASGQILIASTNLQVSTYTIFCNFTPSDTTNYSTVTATKSGFVVTKQTPNITLYSSSTLTYGTTFATFINGTTSTTTGTYNFFINNESGQELTTSTTLNVGIYTIYCKFVPDDLSNYTTQVIATKTLEIQKKYATITPSPNSTIAYQTPMSSVINTTSVNTAGTLSLYILDNFGTEIMLNPTDVLNANTYTIINVFSPTDTANYLSSSITTTLTVSPLSTSITMSPINTLSYGTTMEDYINTTTSTFSGTFTFNVTNNSGQLITLSTTLNVATYSIYCSFYPTDSQNYLPSTASKTLVVQKSSTSISSAVTSLYYGDTFASFIDATDSSVDGTFQFRLTNESGEVLTTSNILNAANYMIYCAFTPTDVTNYLSSTVTLPLQVAKQTTIITMTSINSLVYGSTLSTFINGTTASTTGSFTFTTASGQQLTNSTILDAGVYTIYATIAPDSSNNYNQSTATKTLEIQKYSTAITFSTIGSMTYGTSLATFIGLTTANTTGVFEFYLNDANGQSLTTSTILNANIYTIYCKFIPSDTINYTQTFATKSLQVQKSNTSIIPSSITSITYGTTLASFIAGTTYSVAGTIEYHLSNSTGQVLTSSTILNAGSYTIYSILTPTDTSNYLSSTHIFSLNVQYQRSIISLSSIDTLGNGDTLAEFINGTSASTEGTFVFRLSNASGDVLTPTTVLIPAVYTIYCVFTPTNTTNYSSSTVTKILEVMQQRTTTIIFPSSSTLVYGTTFASFSSGTTSAVSGSFQFYINNDAGQYLTNNTILNTATYTIYCLFMPTDVDNYLQSSSTTVLQVTKRPTSVMLSSMNSFTYGTTFAGFISQTTGSTNGLLKFYLNNASGAEITNATILSIGMQTIYCTLTPTDLTNYIPSNATKTIQVNKISTSISFPASRTITYGTTIESFISGSSGSVSGSLQFYLNDASGQLLNSSTLLNAAVYTIYSVFVPTDNSFYLGSSQSTTFTVQKVSTSLTLSSINSVVYGSTLANFITATTASVSGSFTYRLNSASGQLITNSTILNAGTYTIYCIFVPNDSTNYTSSSATKSFTVQKQVTNISLTALSSIIYGDIFGSFISGTTSSVNGLFNFYLNNASGQLLTASSVLNAGTYTIYCLFVPSDTINYLSSSTTKSLQVEKHSTSVTLSTLNNIVYGETFDAFISSTSASVDGSFNFYLNDESGQLLTGSSVLNVATYTIYCAFTPRDTINYLQSNATKTLIVQKHGTSITLDSTRTIIYGTSLATFINGTSASVGGSLNFYLNDQFGQPLTASTVLNAASYIIYCAFVPNDTTNYSVSSTSIAFDVQKHDTSITLSSINSILYGSTLATFINGTTASVDGSLNFYLNDGFGQRLTASTILTAATYTIYCTFVPADTSNYLSTSTTKSFTVRKNTTTITLPSSIITISPIYIMTYGETLSSFISGTTASVDGSFEFHLNDATGQILTSSSILDASSNYIIYCAFVPTDTTNYLSSSATKTLIVEKRASVITLSSLNSFVYESSFATFINETTASVDGSFNFRLNDAFGPLITSSIILYASTYTIYCEFIPSNSSNYLPASATKTLTVYKRDTSITLPTLDAITYETSLASFINGTSASVNGYFNFYINDASGQLLNSTTILSAATYTIYCMFIPNDTTNYSSSSSSKTLVVNKRDSTLTISSIRTIVYGTTMQPFINSSTASVDGSLNFYLNDETGQILSNSTILSAGPSYTIYCAFVPSDSSNYIGTSSTISLLVQKRATSISLSSINSLTYGNTFAAFISGTTTAQTSGSFTFSLNDASGQTLTNISVLSAGSYTIFCSFVPTDTTNYLSSSAVKSLTVQKHITSISLSSVNIITYGTTLSNFISGTSASVDGSLNFYITNTFGQQLTSSTILNAGTYTIYCAFAPSDSLNYLSSSSTKSLTVQKQSTSITMSSINSIIYTTTLSSFISGTTSSPVPGSLNFYITDASGQKLTSSSVLTVSTYLIYSTFEPNDSTNYLPSTNSKTLQVVKQTSTITLSSITTVGYGDTTEAFINSTTSSVPGTLSFFLNDASGQQVTINTILNAATYTIFCKFDPTDATNYTTATATKQFTTVQKQMTVVYGALSAITYGTTLIDRLNATFTPVVDGSMNYYVNSVQVLPTTVLNAKSTAYTIVATFTPSSSNYTTTSASSSLIVNKAPTTVTYPALESILYNIPIGGACFIATVSPAIDGAMTYFTDSLLSNQVYSNTILAKGNYTLYAKFTPTSTNYAVSSASSPLTVLEILSTTITFPSVTTVAVYTTLASFINSTTTGVAGTYVFRKNTSTGAILTTASTFDVLGNFTIFCSFTPTSNLYLPTSSMYIMSVKYTPTLLFNQRPSSTITYGTNLSGNVLATTVSQFNNTNIPGAITFSNNLTTASILLPGIYTVVATFTPTNLSYYNTVTTTKQILVNKQQLTVMITTPSVKAAFIKSSPITSTYQIVGILTDIGDTFENSVSGTIVNKYMTSDESEVLTSQYVYNTTFSGASQTYKIAADIQGFSSTKYNFTTQSYTFTINKYTPAIAYTISSANKTLSYGTKLGANQLNAVVSYNGTPVTTGSIVYTRSVFNMSQTVNTQTALDVGQYNLYAYYSDTDGNIYNSVNTSTITANQITIVKATPVISFPNIKSILAGTDLNNILGFTVANFNSAIIDGTFVFSYVNQSGATIVVNSSSVLTQPPSIFTISAVFTPTDQTRYTSATGSVTIALSDQTSTLNTTTLLQSPIIYGKPFNELYTISVSPSIAGTYTYYDDVYAFNPASIIDAGTYTYTVIFNPTSTTYASSLVDLTFTIENASLTLSYQSAPAYTYQTANQLSLVQPVKSIAVDGQMQIFLDSSFTTELTNAMAMAVGTHTLYARFTPTKNYNVATVTTTLTITMIPTSLVYATQTSSITYGATNSSFLNNMVVDSIPGTIQYYYDSSYSLVATSTDVMDYGTHTIYTRFVPTDSNYAIAYATHTVNVSKVLLTITYPTLSSIQYGTTLESSLSASATFDGSINYFINSSQVFANTQLNSGSYTITAIFTPTKQFNFTTPSISITRQLTVTKQSTAITYSPANIVSGTTFGSIMTAIVAPNIAGTIRYFINTEEVTSSVVLSSGNYTVYVSFTPTNLTNYVSSSISVPFAVVSSQELNIFNNNVQQIQTASNNEILTIVTQNTVLSSPTINVKVNILNPGQTTFTSNVTNSLVTGLQFNFLDNSMNSATRVAVSTLSVNLPSAPDSPAIYFKFYDETGNSVINANNRVSLVLNLPQYKGITKNLYLLRLQDIGTTFDGTQIPLTPVNPTNSQNIAFTAVFTSNSIYVANIISSTSDETPLLSNLYTFNATGGFVMERGFDDIKLREDTDVESYDVTDSVQVLFDVALFNSKLGINKNDTNTQVISSMFNSITDQFEINNEAVDSITLSSSEFSDGLVKSQQIISVGRYSTLYSDFNNYVAAYFGFDGGFSSLFTAASEFKIDGDNHFDSESMLQLFTNVSTSETGAQFNQVSGNIYVTNITKSLRRAINTNCFGNRDPTVSSTATDPANHSNFGLADGFVAGDLIWVNAGTTVKLNLNIDTEALTPLNNVGPQNTLLQTTNYSSSNFSQETIATTTNINRIVKAPLLIKLVNASTISAL